MPASVAQVLNDPNFQYLPPQERIKVIQKLDPNFNYLPASEQLKVVGGGSATKEVGDNNPNTFVQQYRQQNPRFNPQNPVDVDNLRQAAYRKAGTMFEVGGELNQRWMQAAIAGVSGNPVEKTRGYTGDENDDNIGLTEQQIQNKNANRVHEGIQGLKGLATMGVSTLAPESMVVAPALAAANSELWGNNLEQLATGRPQAPQENIGNAATSGAETAALGAALKYSPNILAGVRAVPRAIGTGLAKASYKPSWPEWLGFLKGNLPGAAGVYAARVGGSAAKTAAPIVGRAVAEEAPFMNWSFERPPAPLDFGPPTPLPPKAPSPSDWRPPGWESAVAPRGATVPPQLPPVPSGPSISQANTLPTMPSPLQWKNPQVPLGPEGSFGTPPDYSLMQKLAAVKFGDRVPGAIAPSAPAPAGASSFWDQIQAQIAGNPMNSGQ